MKRLELAVPPLLLTIVLALCMAALALATPEMSLGLGSASRLAGMTLMAAGIAICAAGVIAFRKAGTTVDPTRPEGASGVVQGGLYALTRNPMYLGFLLLLLGVAAALNHWPSLCLALLFIPYMNRFQIGPE